MYTGRNKKKVHLHKQLDPRKPCAGVPKLDQASLQRMSLSGNCTEAKRRGKHDNPEQLLDNLSVKIQ